MKAKSIIKMAISIPVISLLTGCATMFSKEAQEIKIESVDKNLKPIQQVECKLYNDRGEWTIFTPCSVMIRKSARDLHIIAKKKGYQINNVTLSSDVSKAMMGNFLAGGLVGAMIDNKSGKGYLYPSNVVLTMHEIKK
jgi:hypothetical protein